MILAPILDVPLSSIALVTDRVSLPIDYDMPLLLDACSAYGLEPEVHDWLDLTVDWSRFDMVLLRSTWTYVDQVAEFLAWCDRVAASTYLCNPLTVVRWGVDKTYLADLAAYGVPIVPTEYVGLEGEPVGAVRSVFASHPDAGEIVVKPTVGAYSKDVQRFARSQESAAVEHTARLLRNNQQVILQPYIDSIDCDGETDLVYFDGEYSHAIRKSPMLMPDGTVKVPTLDSRQARVAAADERAVAEAALEAVRSHLGLKQALVYGRIDLIRSVDGMPMVLELELCEPSLNLPFSELAALRFARAVYGRLKSDRSTSGGAIWPV